MAYKIGSQTRAWWPIRFNGVTEEGETVVNEIKGRFKILDEEENLAVERALIEASTAGAPDGQLVATLAPLVERFLEDWRDVLRDDGTPDGESVPFGRDGLIDMLKVPNFAGAVMTAYRAARAGEPVVRRGN